MTTASPLSSAPAEASAARESTTPQKGATRRRRVESREARRTRKRCPAKTAKPGGSRVLSLTHTRSRNCGSRGIFQRRGVGEKEHRPEGRHRRAMTTSRKRAPLGSPPADGTTSENLSRGRRSAKIIQTRGEKGRAAYHSVNTAQQTATRLCRRTPRSPVLASPRSLPPVAACKATSWMTSIPRGKIRKGTPEDKFLPDRKPR